MRHYLKKIIIVGTSFYVAYSLVPTIQLGKDPRNIPLIIGGLLIIFLIINPIFSLVLLPLNHLTFGLLLFILNVAFIFGLLNFLPGFKVFPFNFQGLNFQQLIIPPYPFNEIMTIILVAFIISFVQKILHIIFE